MKKIRILAIVLTILITVQLYPRYMYQASAAPLPAKTPVEDGTWDKSGKYTNLTTEYVREQMNMDKNAVFALRSEESLPRVMFTYDSKSSPTEVLRPQQVLGTGLEDAKAPVVTDASTVEDTQSVSGLVITPNSADSGTVTYFKISAIVGGTLYKSNGTTQILNGDFITVAEGGAGLKFTPAADANSPAGDTFSFQVQAAYDNAGAGISPATQAVITVLEVNDPPVAIDDSLSPINENSGARTIPFASLLGNDFPGPANEGGQTLTITSVGSPVGGSLSFSGNNVIFTPTPGYHGLASFRYTVTDNGTTAGVPDPKSAQATVTFTINKVTSMPTFTVGINNGEGFTNQTDVTLNLTATDSSGIDMSFSNDGVTWSSLERFATTKPWTLSSGEGNKTVHVKFIDGFGNESIQTASIVLDQTKPSGSFQINNGAAFTNSRVVELNTDCSDNMTAVEMSISFDGLNWSAWEAAQSKRTVTLPAGDGVKTVYMKLRDAAGNEQTVVSDTIKLDTTPPTIGLSINAGSMSTTSRQVTLSISGSDANGPLEYRRANEDEDWTSWEPLPGPNWELTAGDGLKTVKLEVRDPAGNVAALSKTITLNTVGPSVTGVVNGGIYNSDVVISFDKGTATLNNASFINNTTVTQEGTYKLNITDIAGFETEVNFIIDKTAPSGSFTINNGAATTSSAQVNLSITAFDNLGQIEMRMAHENDAWSSWQPYTSALTWTLPNGNGQKKVLLELRDEAGNIGRASASITLFMKSSGGGGGGGIPTPSAPEKPKEPVFEPDEPNSPAPTFSDITGYWAESYIKQASAKGIIGGYPDGTFKANASITRAEFTVMLVNALKLEGAAASSEFSDDKQIGAWAKQAIDRALQAGIIAGYDDGSFRPSAAITRAEMAVMFARAMDLQINTNAVSPFADDKAIPEWAKGAVDALHRIGIVNGRGKNRFDPNGPVTRAEATAMLIRMLERKENQ